MSMTDRLIEEELRRIVATGEDGATTQTDSAIIAEATRRALGRAGLMTPSTQDAEAVEHWEKVLGELRDEAANQEG